MCHEYRFTGTFPELVRAYSKPAIGVHSLQIEINRALYMNEETFQRNATYSTLKGALEQFTEDVADYARRASKSMNN